MITTSITVLGLLIVAISMVGLINAITMAILERTREIGMLRTSVLVHVTCAMPELLGRAPAAVAPAGVARAAGDDFAGRCHTRMFQGAVATAAVAAIDDAFVHPEPGTSAGDHLASGLVPVGIAFLLALAYPRLRARAARRRRARLRRARAHRRRRGRVPPRGRRPARRR
jgi:hypothetical protein